MKIEIKSHMIIDDFFTPPENFLPSNIYEFNIGLTFTIGFENNDTEEIFNIRISNKCNKNKIVYIVENISFRKGCIEISCYNYIDIMSAIVKYLDNINTNSWEDALKELRKVFEWEFDDYKE